MAACIAGHGAAACCRSLGDPSMASVTTSAAAAGPRLDRPHVVLVASPGAGHLMPMAELARRLVAHHTLAATLVTFAVSADRDAHSAAVLSSPRAANVSTATLPAVPLDDLPADARIETVILEVIGRSIPHLRALLRDVGSTAAPLAALVPDFWATAVLPLASELGVPGYIFFPSNLNALSVGQRAVELNDGAGTGVYRDLPDPLPLPGGVSLRREDLPDGFRDTKEPVYAHLNNEGHRYRAAAGFLVNTFSEMDPVTVEEYKKAAAQGRFPPAYPVGPCVRSISDEGSVSSPCIEWLDQQPSGSVVYVSFGSAGTLSVEQTAKLAAGLEDSGHRFLWIVRMPSLDGEHSDDMGRISCGSGDENDPLAWLPKGFLERTLKGYVKSLTVASWAPQVRVLSHPVTAAFVSHCGWNSTLESVSFGVPMVAWPLYAEQRLNAVVLSENVGVALRLRVHPDDGLVGREEIAAAVRELMEGKDERAVRRRTGDLQQAADLASAPNGSSRRTLEEVAGRWKAGALGKTFVVSST